MGMLLYVPDSSGGFPPGNYFGGEIVIGNYSNRISGYPMHSFKDIYAAVRMVEQLVRVAAHNQSSSNGVGMGSHD